MASSMGIAMQNSVSQQQNSNAVAQAVTTKCIETLIGKIMSAQEQSNSSQNSSVK